MSIEAPKSPKCKKGQHDDCTGWASVDKTYGNTACWCDCHDTEKEG